MVRVYLDQTRGSPTPTMTAEALLCWMYPGLKNDRPGLVHGVEWLSERPFASASKFDIYYWYYATQVMHHHGGPEWDRGVPCLRDLLVSSQETQGHLAGKLPPRGNIPVKGAAIDMTALAICTLEVYYRHLPIFRGD